jgi:ATP-dependent helicase HrpA
MQPIEADNKTALRQARRDLDQACTRDRGRLLGLWSKWNASPDDAPARERFQDALERSLATRQARAAALPQAEVDANLPIAREAGRIVDLIRAHPVVVVAGETGSGKTTQLPKLCLAAGRGAGGMIGCTQPRRIAARAVARRVAEELQVPLGGAVGFQVRFNEQVGEQTAIKFMTDGILLAEIASDRWLSRYDTIIVDEAHERSLNIDFLLGYLKQLLPRRPDLKVIVTSATIDTERFAAHFGGAPVVDVEGRGYPVEVRYRPLEGEGEDEGERTVLDGIVAACDEIFSEGRGGGSRSGDTLVFLPGEREIRDVHQALERRKYRHTEVLPLYARLSARDQDRVFHPGTQRRIVLATNVAETSLTVPRIHYVVDPGLARVKRYSPRQKLDRLHIETISQASADQRKGRCGRIAPGVCYRLYSEAEFAARPQYTDPEIRRAALAGVILRMLTLGLGRFEGRAAAPKRASGRMRSEDARNEDARNQDARIVENFPFLEPPDPRAIADGWQQLSELGAVDAERRLTAIGRAMAKLPIDVKLARMLVAAQKHGCLPEMLAIASFLGIQDPRERPADARAAADTAHAQFADPKSEFAGILKLWDAYRQAHEDLTQSQLRKWADRHFLGFLRLREWRELHRQLKLQCEELGWNTLPSPTDHPKEEHPPLKKGGRGDLRAQRAVVHRQGQSQKQIPLDPPSSKGEEKPVSLGERKPVSKEVEKPASREEKPASRAAEAGAAASYARLHRALIAGLPTQLGHLVERGVYDGPRGRKFQLFPGSVLAKKPPPWVLSATLLDTEKVWALTNAAIEPDWAIDELPHLLNRRHHDPRWSRAQGRVIGSEQISLFGLVLAPKRHVHYGALYPAEARAIFLRDALVAGEINTRSAFLARNLKTLDAAKEEEAKLRRTGLVIDEDAQVQWYDERIPQHIVDAQALDAWYAKLSKDGRTALEWTLDDLLAVDEADGSRFPAFIALGETRLAVRYRFEPGAPDDGMTVVVPLHLLNALDPARLSWLAPGFVQDKAAALIKSLPKALRRNFVPAPDFARAFAQAHPQPGHADEEPDSIEGALARFLKRLTGVEIAATDFEPGAIEPHLHANLRLLDVPSQGRDARVLAESRDLAELRARFGARAAQVFAARAAEGLARRGLTAFPDEPVPVSVQGAGGVPAYPALQDDGDSVSLAVHAERHVAERLHPQGVRRLLAFALADKMKQARRQLPVQTKTALLYAAIESNAPRAGGGRDGDRLREDLVEGAFAALASDGLEDVRNPTAFAAWRDAIAKALFPEAMRRLQQAEAILLQVSEVRAKLDSRLIGWARGNLDDMQAQLDALVRPGFLRDVPANALAEYPRWLKALALRAERALRDPAKDQARMLELRPFTEAVDAALAAQPQDQDWQALRWDLEELRVATFAQELGAKGGVSPKKFAARVAQLQAAVG